MTRSSGLKSTYCVPQSPLTLQWLCGSACLSGSPVGSKRSSRWSSWSESVCSSGHLLPSLGTLPLFPCDFSWLASYFWISEHLSSPCCQHSFLSRCMFRWQSQLMCGWQSLVLLSKPLGFHLIRATSYLFSSCQRLHSDGQASPWKPLRSYEELISDSHACQRFHQVCPLASWDLKFSSQHQLQSVSCRWRWDA